MEKSKNNKWPNISKRAKKILFYFSIISIAMLLFGIKVYLLSKNYVSSVIDLNILSQGLIQNSFVIFLEGLGAAILFDYFEKK
ncbi:hypothetical protein ACAG39_08750 [Caldicellulosiruptoraceae bacterium PP1]